jgi:dipeptidyl aminopeptidase/acylaminoacyl peptidase
MNRIHALLACLVLAFGTAPLHARALNVDDYDRFADPHDVQVSPDGAWVAYVVTTSDRAADKQRSTVWMVSWDGTKQVPVSAPLTQASAPRWSPDGRTLAFVGSAADGGNAQIMLFDRSGARVRTLTELRGAIGEYAWSADGRRLVFVMETGAEAAHSEDASPAPIVIDAVYFKADPAGYFARGQRQHLYIADVATGAVTALTDDARFNDDLPAWSPDGSHIAFIRTREHSADEDGMCDVDVIDAPAASSTAVAARLSTLVRIYTPNEQHLAWSPDGRMLAFLQGLEPKYNSYMQDRLAVIPAAGGAVRPLSDSLDRAVSAYAFADAGSILVSIEDDATRYPARIDLRTGAIRRLHDGPSVISGISSAAGHTAVLYADDATPDEIYALEAKGLRRLTRHNDALMSTLTLGRVEDLRFRSADGTEIHGLMVKPPDFVAGKKYPTLLWLHGGPSGQDEHAFTFDLWQFKRQMFAAKGYVVIGINYRGGSGRGLDFAKAIFADWGHLEVQDLLAGVDHVVALGIADPGRLGIGGRSYGGILTDYTIAGDQRFRAAMSIAGSGNPIAMYGTDQYFLADTYELGPPWRNPDLWMKLSYPLFHADRIHTPTLFIGNTRDFNVPIAGAEQMYQALRTLGVPTELVVYPGEYHDLTRPSFMRDQIERVAAWFERYSRDTPLQ